MRSVVAQGYQFELFTYDPRIIVPAWIRRRDAREILPTDHVMVYRTGRGIGSPALHSDLFRYKMLNTLGGWWLDLDVLLLRSDFPTDREFYACDPRGVVLAGVLKFPSGDPLLTEAIARCRAVDEYTALWDQTGPGLLTRLINEFERTHLVRAYTTAYALDHHEMEAVFDPSRYDEVRERCKASWFLHLYNELRRRTGFPRDAGPPPGSYLDRLFVELDLPTEFPYRLELPLLKCWLHNHYDANTYKTLYEQRDKERSEACAQLDRVTAEKDARLRERDAAITERDEALAQLARITEEKEARLRERDVAITERDGARNQLALVTARWPRLKQ